MGCGTVQRAGDDRAIREFRVGKTGRKSKDRYVRNGQTFDEWVPSQIWAKPPDREYLEECHQSIQTP